MAIYNVNKPLGWTPLQALETLREQRPELADSFMTYAGRLDPMAEGVLIALTDDDRFRAVDFQALPKTYRATILFGYVTDSYDALGVAQAGGVVERSEIEAAMTKLEGVHPLPFPPYSSYKVQGQPLHAWAKQDRLDEIEIPVKDMQVTKASLVTWGEPSPAAVLADIQHRIGLVDGDFRQREILNSWLHLLVGERQLLTATLTLEVTSGTYIRSLAQALGVEIGCGAVLLNLVRTRVGDYALEDALPLLKS